MKKLIIVSGTMGVGKSATCRLLYKMAPRSVWLDGDWCWLMNPWNNCQENREMVMKNISTLLRAYLANSTIDNVIFSWVLHKKEIIDDLLERLSGSDYDLFGFALVCSPEALSGRMLADGREEDQIMASKDRLHLYYEIGWEVLDTTSLDECQAAKHIAKASGIVGAPFQDN